MITFKQAIRRHAFIEQAVEHDLVMGEQLWAGVTGKAGAAQGLMADAAADTTPQEYATLVSIDDIAAGYGVATIAEAEKEFREEHGRSPATPHEAREVAHAGWAAFKEMAEQSGYIEHGTGADMSKAWPVIHQLQQGKVDTAKIKQIAMLAGRMTAALRGAKAKRSKQVPEEIIGIEQGADFPALVPSEYALLATDPTKRELFRRMSMRETVQFERAGRDKKARGPLVIAIDESGSMTGDPEVWSKAVMSALTRLAWEDKRPVVIVHFSMATRAVRLNPGDIAKLVAAQQTFLDGGTDIGRALRVALEEVDSLAKAGVKGADMVLISDGGDAGRTIEASLDEADKKGIRLWSFAIGVPFNGPLKKRAAAYVFLQPDDLTNPNSVLKVKDAVGL